MLKHSGGKRVYAHKMAVHIETVEEIIILWGSILNLDTSISF